MTQYKSHSTNNVNPNNSPNSSIMNFHNSGNLFDDKKYKFSYYELEEAENFENIINDMIIE